MNRTMRVLERAGFTLIEILVTLILLSLLVAAVFPVVSQQLGQADAPRMANDLVSLRSGIEAFNANVRKGFPGDLEDLVFQPSGSDVDVTGGAYISQISTRWDGPYVDITASESSTATGTAFESGFSAFVDYDLTCFNPASTAATGNALNACADGHFVTVQVTSLDTASFTRINELFDGSTETTQSDRRDKGKMRCNASGTTCTTAFYLAVPFRS